MRSTVDDTAIRVTTALLLARVTAGVVVIAIKNAASVAGVPIRCTIVGLIENDDLTN